MKEEKILLKRMPKETDSIPKQARALLAVLSAKGGKLTLAELTEAAKGKVKTVQTIPAIFRHYQKTLVKHGFVRVAL